jgi:succinoglycan biosynthesis protein ExoM
METIDICICTFRRDSVADTIASVSGRQSRRGCAPASSWSTTTTHPTARDRAGAGRHRGGLEINYLHAPGRNISLARNAALAASHARFLAFLDDDEMAEPGGSRRSGRATGKRRPRSCWAPSTRSIPTRRPDWMRPHAVHATRPVFVQGEIRTGYTCNVLIDRARPEIRALRFDPELGRSGGEDSDYFTRMVLMGGRIDYAPEDAGDRAGRARKAEFRLAGAAALPDGHDPCGRADAPSGRGALARGSRGHGQAIWPAAALRWPSQAHRGWRAAAVLRGVLHAGVVAGLVGRRAPVLYGGTPDGAERTHEPAPPWPWFRHGFPARCDPNRRRRGAGRAAPGRAAAVLGDGGRRRHRHRRALFHYATSPKTFEASATLLIEEQRAELEQEISAALPTARNDTSMLNEMQILASLQVASDVVDDAGSDGQPAFPTRPRAFCRRRFRRAKASVRALIPSRPGARRSPAEDADAAADRALMQAAHGSGPTRCFTASGAVSWSRSGCLHDPVLAADIVNAYADAYIADGIRATVQSADERAAGWRRGCRICGPRRRPRRRRPSSSAAMSVSPISRACGTWSNRPRR